jgi:hypothetical protein
MPDFPHLPLPHRASGTYNAPRGGARKRFLKLLQQINQIELHMV